LISRSLEEKKIRVPGQQSRAPESGSSQAENANRPLRLQKNQDCPRYAQAIGVIFLPTKLQIYNKSTNNYNTTKLQIIYEYTNN